MVNGRSPGQVDWLQLCDDAADLSPVERSRQIVQHVWPDEDVDADTPGWRNRRLLTLRREMFGRHLACVVNCPACGELLDVEVDTDQILSWADPIESTIALGEWTFRLPSQRDLFQATRPGVEHPVMDLALRCVVSTGPADLDRLDDAVVEQFSRGCELADPLGHLPVDLHCPQCAEASQPILDVAAVLWSDLTAMSARLVGQIHLLAGAYGWSEADILALPERRRRRYLELVGS